MRECTENDTDLLTSAVYSSNIRCTSYRALVCIPHRSFFFVSTRFRKVSIFIPALQAMSRCGFPKMDTKKAANLFQDLLLFGAIAKEPSNFYARTGCDFQSSYSTSRFQKIADTHTPIAYISLNTMTMMLTIVIPSEIRILAGVKLYNLSGCCVS